MALLIDIRDPNWMREQELRDILAPQLNGVEIVCGPPEEQLDHVEMLVATRLHPGVAELLPNLKLIQKLGAGVETMVHAPDLPSHVRITRLKADGAAQEIAEYCLAYVLREQRNIRAHEKSSVRRHWEPLAPKQSPLTTVGVLGLGHIGARTASTFAALNFRVLGWSRSPKSIDGVECRHGNDALAGLLSECDYVASILPSTAQTRDLFNSELFAAMKPNAVLINAGRGDLIVDDDLIAALNNGQLSGAVLDVFRHEPLPTSHLFWQHDKVTVTPHVSGWHIDGCITDIAENYKRLLAGQPLLNEVDRASGY